MAKQKESARDFERRMIERIRKAAYHADGFINYDPVDTMARHLYELTLTGLRAAVPGHQRSSIPWRLQVETSVSAVARRVRNWKGDFGVR